MTLDLPASAYELFRLVRDDVADLDTGRPLIVACSGGPDSLALAAVAGELPRRIHAVVIDHGLQSDSTAVATAAATQCAELGLESIVLPVTVTETGSGLEAAARSARYSALREAATRFDAAAVLLGHTLDDQAETVLLGIARGSGPRSIAGMPARRDVFRRPFLRATRRQIEAAIGDLGLAAWQDPHNNDERFLRVKARLRVMPVLAEVFGPTIAGNLARTADLARADCDALDTMAAEALATTAAAGWSLEALASMPAAIRTRVLRSGLLAAGTPASDLTYAHVLAVDTLITGWRGQGPLLLPGRVTVTRKCGRLDIARTHTTERSADGS